MKELRKKTEIEITLDTCLLYQVTPRVQEMLGLPVHSQSSW